MNVSLHARGQLLGRMPAPEAVAIIRELEESKPPKEKEARIIRRYGEQRSDGQSNGDVLVAIIERGTVVTVYWRRGNPPRSGVPGAARQRRNPLSSRRSSEV